TAIQGHREQQGGSGGQVDSQKDRVSTIKNPCTTRMHQPIIHCKPTHNRLVADGPGNMSPASATSTLGISKRHQPRACASRERPAPITTGETHEPLQNRAIRTDLPRRAVLRRRSV